MAYRFIKKDSCTGVFLYILQNLYDQVFYKTPRATASELNEAADFKPAVLQFY